jgi:ESCRT-II complex subunit VPS25
MWLDAQKQACLILWRKIDEWAQVILAWAGTYGVSDAVMLLEDLSSGDDVRNTGEGHDRGVPNPMRRALHTLFKEALW